MFVEAEVIGIGDDMPVLLTKIDPKRFEPQIDIEIFLRVKGRLPTRTGDKLTAEICEEFIEKYSGHPEHGRWVGHAFKRMAELLQ